MAEYTHSLPGAYQPLATIQQLSVRLSSAEPTAPLGLMLESAAHVATAQGIVERTAAGTESAVLEEVSARLETATGHLAQAIGALTTASYEIDHFKSGAGIGGGDDLAGRAEQPASTEHVAPSQPAVASGVRNLGTRSHSAGRNARRKGKGRRHGGRATHGIQQEYGEPIDFEYLTLQEFRAGLDGVVRNFLSQLPYNALAAETRRALMRGNEDAFFVPAVRFILDGVVAMLDREPVRSRLPTEMDARAAVAQYYAHKTARVAVKGGVFDEFYRNNVFVRDFITPELLATLRGQSDYIGTLGSALFSDASIVAGGALRAVRAQGGAPDEVKVITGSPELMLVAGVPKGSSREVFAHLGIPYVEGSELIVQTDEAGTPTEVKFRPEAHAYLRSHFAAGKGCPARQLRATEGAYRTELDRGWADAVRFLMPPGVTVKSPPARAIA